MPKTWKSNICGCLFDVTDEPFALSNCERHLSYAEALAENNSLSNTIEKIEEELTKGLGEVTYLLIEKRTLEGKEEIISEKELVNYVPPEKSFEIIEKEDGTKEYEFVGYTEKELEILEKMTVSAQETIPEIKG